MALGAQFAKRSPLIRTARSALAWSLLLYLRCFARLALFIHRPTIIGIAGAVGKSTAKQALSAIFTPYAPTRTVDGNSETGIPLGILNLTHGTYSIFDWLTIIVLAPLKIANLKTIQFLIIEYGIDGPQPPKNMGYLLTIVTPEIAILLNESPAHVENYQTVLTTQLTNSLIDQLEKIVDFMTTDDGRLLTAGSVTTAIVNADDPRVYDFATRQVPRGKLFTVGTSNQHDVSMAHHEVTPDGTRFLFAVHTHQVKDSVEVIIPRLVLPEEAGTVVATAILTAVHVGIPIETIKTNLEQQFTLPPGRGSILAGIGDSIILDSSYNASSASVLSFLKTLKQLRLPRQPTVFLFGDMKELGQYAEYEHGLVAKSLPGIVDHLLLVGQYTKQYILPYAQKHQDKFKTIMWFETITEASEYLTKHLPERSILLVKGSQNLEEAIKKVLKNPKDKQKLCRQDAFWEENKKKRGIWI